MSPILTLYKGRVQVLEIHNLTICTMKIIILFALAAVSVCRGQGENSHSSSSSSSSSVTMCDAPYNNEHANDETCMKHALEHVPELFKRVQDMICKYRNQKTPRKEKFYSNNEYELREIGRCAGCQLDDLLGTGKTLENTVGGTGTILGEVIKALGNLLAGRGLAKPVGNMLCGSTNIMDHLHGDDSSGLLDDGLAAGIPDFFWGSKSPKGHLLGGGNRDRHLISVPRNGLPGAGPLDGDLGAGLLD